MEHAPGRIQRTENRLTTRPFYCVVTTIQAPTPAIRRLSAALAECGGRLLVAGDRKGPQTYPAPHAELLTLQQQVDLPLRLGKLLPVNHYGRKNVAYLVAISRQAGQIYETDDDNAPMDGWKIRPVKTKALAITEPGWENVYAHFGGARLWPRGFPLDEILAERQLKGPKKGAATEVYSPIQQGLADGNPDVDAIWRLTLSSDVRFARRTSVALRRGVWCPFNSQTTWWWPEVYPLLYLPSYCTFRMTDIWRSFVAQRCVWELDGAVAFHAPEVFQDRNEHNLMRDFLDEVPGYLGNVKICQCLDGLKLQRGAGGVEANLMACYEALVGIGIFPKKELRLLRAWLADLKAIAKGLVL